MKVKVGNRVKMLTTFQGAFDEGDIGTVMEIRSNTYTIRFDFATVRVRCSPRKMLMARLSVRERFVDYLSNLLKL